MSRRKRVRVGDWVRFSLGADQVLGEVVRDHGNIGVDGRQLVMVSVGQAGVEEPHTFDMPGDELEVVPRPPKVVTSYETISDVYAAGIGNPLAEDEIKAQVRAGNVRVEIDGALFDAHERQDGKLGLRRVAQQASESA